MKENKKIPSLKKMTVQKLTQIQMTKINGGGGYTTLSSQGLSTSRTDANQNQ